MRKLCFILLCACFAAEPLLAGVVFDVETREPGSQEVTTSRASVEGSQFKMEIDKPGDQGKGEMIYRGDRREMVMVDHDRKSYFVLDAEGITKLAGEISAAVSDMEEALKNVPEDQRKELRRLMEEHMPQTQPSAVPNTELTKADERATRAGYPCVRYDVLKDGKKVREMWVTEWKNVDGGEEVAGMFQEMSGFLRDMMAAFQTASGSMGEYMTQVADNMFENMAEIDGFPVVSRELENGRVKSEATLTSVERRKLEPAEFEPPAGYTERQIFQRKKSRH